MFKRKRKPNDFDDTPPVKKRKIYYTKEQFFIKIKELLVEAYVNSAANDLCAIENFKNTNQNEDGGLTKEDYINLAKQDYDRKLSILRKINGLSNEEVLSHIFGTNNLDSAIVGENKEIFQEILDLFLKHFDQVCPEAQRSTYLIGAIKLCMGYDGIIDGFADLKIFFNFLQTLNNSKIVNEIINEKNTNKNVPHL
jgi:hypothetical protein